LHSRLLPPLISSLFPYTTLFRSCHACNEYKGSYYQPGSSERLLHPLHDNLREHILEQEDGTLQALTLTGTWHIEQLHLNRPALRSEEHTSELQSRFDLVCRLLLE